MDRDEVAGDRSDVNGSRLLETRSRADEDDGTVVETLHRRLRHGQGALTALGLDHGAPELVRSKETVRVVQLGPGGDGAGPGVHLRRDRRD